METEKPRKSKGQIEAERGIQKRRRERRSQLKSGRIALASNQRRSDHQLTLRLERCILEGDYAQAEIIRELIRMRHLVSRRAKADEAVRLIARFAEGGLFKSGGKHPAGLPRYHRPLTGYYDKLKGIDAGLFGSPIGMLVRAIDAQRARIRATRKADLANENRLRRVIARRNREGHG